MSERSEHKKRPEPLAAIEQLLHMPPRGSQGEQDGGESEHLSLYMKWPIFTSICLLLLCIAVILTDWRAGLVASVCSIIIVIVLMGLSIYYHRQVSSDMVTFGAGYAQIQKQLLQEMAVPYAVTDEYGKLIWMNHAFSEIVKKGKEFHKNISSLFPGLSQQFPRDRRVAIVHGEYEGRKYEITIKGVPIKDIMEAVINPDDQEEGTPLMFAIYLTDETELAAGREKMENERLVLGLVYLDNFDEVMESVEEVRRTLLTAMIDRQIAQYFHAYQAVVKRLENDKYMVIFTSGHLKEMKMNDFALTENVKKINMGNGIAVTVSIGLGVNGTSYADNFNLARKAIDMALGRGGDQVALNDHGDIQYFGGRSESQERNTHVKARVKADALEELITGSSDVLIMGHRISDADCIGAAIGIYRAARTSEKNAHIVLTEVATSIKPLLERLRSKGDYKPDIFITGDQALGLIGRDTLLVVVDTNRPGITECPQLLTLAQKVVVLDHHRKPADFIEDADLSYVETGASSASEMVAEILQYYAGGVRIRATDAEAMYAGILVDTNNFLNKIGVRTFEAAALLRRSGADASLVRKLFRDEIEDYRAKAQAVANAEIFHGCYAISICPAEKTSSPTVVGAQAANDLLGIKGVKASFVMTDYEGQIHISARSIDEMNVQVLMERLGGGGHLSVAGAQLKGITAEEAVERLKKVLEEQETPVYSESEGAGAEPAG